jgi:EF hand
MARRTVIALSLLLAGAAAHADTTNVREGQSQLRFLPAAAPASGGATARPPASDKEAVFRRLDIDGDGFVSKAEAAGHEAVTVGFDRADRNRDGKLSFAEYDSIGKPRPARKKTARGPGSASAGATKKPD